MFPDFVTFSSLEAHKGPVLALLPTMLVVLQGAHQAPVQSLAFTGDPGLSSHMSAPGLGFGTD